MSVAYDDQLEDEDYDLIAENTGIQLKKKFRRVHGNVLDSDEEEGEEAGHAESAAPAAANSSFTKEDSMDSAQDEDFAHVGLTLRSAEIKWNLSIWILCNKAAIMIPN